MNLELFNFLGLMFGCFSFSKLSILINLIFNLGKWVWRYVIVVNDLIVDLVFDVVIIKLGFLFGLIFDV